MFLTFFKVQSVGISRNMYYLCNMKKRKDIYDKLNHSKFSIRYHFIFSTKYRRKCLEGIEELVIDAFAYASSRCNFRVEHIGIDKDHVHLLVKSCPSMSPLSIVRRLKQITTRELWERHSEHFKKYYIKKRVVWSCGYFCGTVGEVSRDKIIEYIETQG